MTATTPDSHVVPVPLKRSQLRIALAQIAGPTPTGKHPSFANGRESLHWKSQEAVETRIRKARGVMHHLEEHHAKVDIAIFPEYSLPVEAILPFLRKWSDEKHIIIIGGSDNILDSASGKIYNMSPVLIPGLPETIWIKKTELSQWEAGYVDEAGPNLASSIFTWKSGKNTYWFTVHICLDMTLAHEHPAHKRTDPGLFIVPMSTPDMDTFRPVAEFLIRNPSGRACLLCNAVDDQATGSSSVIAVTPGGKRNQPAITLSNDSETLLIFELDCSALAPPKKTPLRSRVALGVRKQFLIQQTSSGNVQFVPREMSDEPPTIGIINPAIFNHCNVQMRVALLQVNDYAEVARRGSEADYELLAVLGQHDLMMTALSQDPYYLAYQIKKLISGPSVQPHDAREEREEDFEPHFDVEKYYKVLGREVTPAHREALKRPGAVPSRLDLDQLFLLGESWDAPSVSAKEKSRFKKKQWIIGETRRRPGEINAIMTISLNKTGKLARPLAMFENRILPRLVRRREITSFYGGVSRVGIHYVARITTPLERVYSLIEDIHGLASKFQILISTTTYVVVHKISSLSLRQACLSSGLPQGDLDYLHWHLQPYWSDEDRRYFDSLPDNHKEILIARFQRIETALDMVQALDWIKDSVDDFRRNLAKGLLHEKFELIREVHDRTQGRVESELSREIGHFDPAVLEEISNRAGIPKKEQGRLTYGERLRILRKSVELGYLGLERLELLNSLDKTVPVRNSLNHSRFEDLTSEALVDSICLYCQFHVEWNSAET